VPQNNARKARRAEGKEGRTEGGRTHPSVSHLCKQARRIVSAAEGEIGGNDPAVAVHVRRDAVSLHQGTDLREGSREGGREGWAGGGEGGKEEGTSKRKTQRYIYIYTCIPVSARYDKLFSRLRP